MVIVSPAPAARLSSAAVGALFALAVLAAPHVADAQPVASTIWIPVTETTASGATRELTLESFLYQPTSSGPFPVLVFNHDPPAARASRRPRRPPTAIRGRSVLRRGGWRS